MPKYQNLRLYVSDIDNCASFPCENGGTCTDDINSYTCICIPGYTGSSCSVGRTFLSFVNSCNNARHLYIQSFNLYQITVMLFIRTFNLIIYVFAFFFAFPFFCRRQWVSIKVSFKLMQTAFYVRVPRILWVLILTLVSLLKKKYFKYL